MLRFLSIAKERIDMAESSVALEAAPTDVR
jgi:hypothetical protein